MSGSRSKTQKSYDDDGREICPFFLSSMTGGRKKCNFGDRCKLSHNLPTIEDDNADDDSRIESTESIGSVDVTSTPEFLEYWKKYYNDRKKSLVKICGSESAAQEYAFPLAVEEYLASIEE